MQKEVPAAIPLPRDFILNEQFSDEFDSGALDRNKWYDFSPEWHGRKPGYFDRKNVSLHNGMLQLAARELSAMEVSEENKVRGYDRFSTAFVRSRQRLLYGYFEMRFQAMNSSVSSAFWLNDPLDSPAKYRPGDYSEEIDIFEVFGKSHEEKDAEHKYFMTLHRFATPYVETKVNFQDTKSGAVHWNPSNFSTEFRTAGFLWNSDTLIWYLDGIKLWEQPNLFYHRPLYVNIDSEVMLEWTGLPKTKELPSIFSVDYIRVWQSPKTIRNIQNS